MARFSIQPVLICLGGLLALVSGMPQARNGGPRAPPGRPSAESQVRVGPGPGDGSGRGESEVYRCPGCDTPFTTVTSLRQHRARRAFLAGKEPEDSEARDKILLCAPDDRRPPVVSLWQAAGQRAGGRVQNRSRADGPVSAGYFGILGGLSDSDAESHDSSGRRSVAGPSRSRSPSPHANVPSPSAADAGAVPLPCPPAAAAAPSVAARAPPPALGVRFTPYLRPRAAFRPVPVPVARWLLAPCPHGPACALSARRSRCSLPSRGHRIRALPGTAHSPITAQFPCRSTRTVPARPVRHARAFQVRPARLSRPDHFLRLILIDIY
jgi:hypothetical protein